MADFYRERVSQLGRALQGEDSRPEVSEAMRQLVEAIILEPDATRSKLNVTLKGPLAGC